MSPSTPRPKNGSRLKRVISEFPSRPESALERPRPQEYEPTKPVGNVLEAAETVIDHGFDAVAERADHARKAIGVELARVDEFATSKPLIAASVAGVGIFFLTLFLLRPRQKRG